MTVFFFICLYFVDYRNEKNDYRVCGYDYLFILIFVYLQITGIMRVTIVSVYLFIIMFVYLQTTGTKRVIIVFVYLFIILFDFLFTDNWNEESNYRVCLLVFLFIYR